MITSHIEEGNAGIQAPVSSAPLDKQTRGCLEAGNDERTDSEDSGAQDRILPRHL
jgi:hypothetical protein